MPRLQLADVELYFEEHGAGPPLLLIAGLASDSQSWLAVLPALAAQHRVIVVDNRGCGRTAPQDAPNGVAAMADDCAALLRHLGLARVAVVGHSMGGFVAQALAARHPGLVGPLVLAATAARNSPRNGLLFRAWATAMTAGQDPAQWLLQLLLWILTPRFFADPAAVRAAIDYGLTYPYPQAAPAFAAQVDALCAFDGTAALPHLPPRTLVLAGADDLLFPIPASRELHAAIPGATMAVIDGAAHAIALEQPAAFAAAVLGFIDGER